MNYIKTKIISAFLLVVIVIIVFFTSFLNEKYNRYVLFFKNSITGKIDTEIRYVQTQNHLCYSFVPSETKLLSCFVKDGILYADLPLVFVENIRPEFDSDAIKELLEKNIFTNCKTLQAACIFVEGVEIYELLKK